MNDRSMIGMGVILLLLTSASAIISDMRETAILCAIAAAAFTMALLAIKKPNDTWKVAAKPHQTPAAETMENVIEAVDDAHRHTNWAKGSLINASNDPILFSAENGNAWIADGERICLEIREANGAWLAFMTSSTRTSNQIIIGPSRTIPDLIGHTRLLLGRAKFAFSTSNNARDRNPTPLAARDFVFNSRDSRVISLAEGGFAQERNDQIRPIQREEAHRLLMAEIKARPNHPLDPEKPASNQPMR